MEIYLIRHARAIRGGEMFPDTDRYLLPEGRQRFRKAARRLAKRGMAPEIILSSPLVRAVQTAEILAAALDFDGPLVITARLSPGFGMQDFDDLLAEHGGRRLALVGHNPDLSEIATALTGDVFALKKGETVALEFHPDRLEPARLLWRELARRSPS